MKRLTRQHEQHHDLLRELGCLITRRPYPTIHHCHSGSMSDLGYLSGNALRGVTTGPDGPVDPHFLVIPLAVELHSIGPCAIDGGMGVRTWERTYKTQVELLDILSRRLGVNVWRLARAVRFVAGAD